MYKVHFGLKSNPFSITPDPQYLYLSTSHREALAHLSYGIIHGPGFVLLTGDIGTGKTTLCRALIDKLPETVDVALLLNPRLSAMELLAALFDELRINYNPQEQNSLKDFTDKLTSYLLTAHAVERSTVLILDEAQNLTTEVLEQVRLLTNLETTSHKLLQIVLVGQPELNRLIARNNLRQLSQRITARYQLSPLSLKDTCAYIKHRLKVSGARSALFSDSAMREVYHYSGGIPRLINIICDRALLGGFTNNKTQINPKIIQNAEQEVRGEQIKQGLTNRWLIGIVVSTICIGVLIWWGFFYTNKSTIATSNLSQEIFVSSTVATEPTLDLLSLLKTTDTESAFITLFDRWDLDYSNLTGQDLCERAATQGLACLKKTGTWADIRRFNRPALLKFDSGSIVITHLQDESATLTILGQRFDFAINDINQYWHGEFLLLWQPPTLPLQIIKVGSTDKAVIWIRKHLKYNADSLSLHFDQVLKEQVMAFQAQQYLKPDGAVGEKTMLALQALSTEEPLLDSTKFFQK